MAKRQLHKLSAREAETIIEPGRHSDGGGLYLAIETGAHARRQWIFLYRARGTGKRREIGLGAAKGKGRDGISLADARLKAADTRKRLAEGKDPAAERRAEIVAATTFGEFADAFLVSIKAGFKGKNTLADWTRDLKVRCKPIRGIELANITVNDVLGILSPIWMTINRTARETRSRIERVLDAAEARGVGPGPRHVENLEAAVAEVEAVETPSQGCALQRRPRHRAGAASQPRSGGYGGQPRR
ncbi:Arm DNA-binding domain-containing protein [Bradyrhizobium sp. CCBAU 45394]|uniref:Arm DNA-binding domain-containing protein n=1 Tax=Bradyrhizobium sp. CCBAU 45394 TaxID=1325087 RepID=UPI0023042248|nr:Arm DNA-binding domain-containing protein [Bradyrhizobium sp. CCBAU 45394]